MPHYLLLLRAQAGFDSKTLSPEQIQMMVQKYKDWTDKLRTAGKFVAADKLRDNSGRVMRRGGTNPAVTDGPYIEAREVLGGFYVIDARNYDEALEFSRTCPNLEFGSIEIREIENL